MYHLCIKRLSIWRRNREMWEGKTCTSAWWSWAGCHGDECVGVVSMVAVVLPVTHANPRSVGDVGGGRLRTINLVRRAGRPSHPLYSAATRAHHSGTNGRPRSGRERRGRTSRWARTDRDQSNILPLDLNFTFNFILYTLLISSLISI
jgi:hypothetical protein